MTSHYIEDPPGTLRPLEPMEWARMYEDSDARRVAEDHILLRYIGAVRVSTVWLGCDHSCGGPPLIYETMIFGGPCDGRAWHYTYRAEALAGHAYAVALVSTRGRFGPCRLRLTAEETRVVSSRVAGWHHQARSPVTQVRRGWRRRAVAARIGLVAARFARMVEAPNGD